MSDLVTAALAQDTQPRPAYLVELVNPAAVPHRARCRRCPWQATGFPTVLVEATGRHTLAHALDDERKNRRARS